ncbi:hypothetical protein VTJ83DRAFT_1709 [Remersonia thermophila]|uniref:Neurofilament medium polypeptide protein n=1 Tax=Remersonia thermophila TaxID=72144 RepID=A0ABR4DGN9_9PEZI
MRLPLAAVGIFFCSTVASASQYANDANLVLNAAGVLLPRQNGRLSLQAFTGALGGAPASPIIKSDDPERPFEVDGDTFNDFESAANRACDNQKNVCANLANNGTGNFKVGDCDLQNEQCKSAARAATVREFPEAVLVDSNDEFDFFCDP